MSDSRTVLPPGSRRATPNLDRSALPQWVIDFVRLPLNAISKIFWRTQYVGLEHLPKGGGLIIAANHQTYFDPFWVGLPVKRALRFLAWNEIFQWPVIGRLITLLGAWPIQLEKSDPAAIRRSLQWLREGGAVVIFPEGGRARLDGVMGKFKKGAVRIALEANVPILPATILGGNRVWPKGYSFPRFRKVQIIFHPAINVALLEGEDARACARRETDRLQTIIGADLRS